MTTVDDWCTSCRQHRAPHPGGVCPVCAPTGDLLERIDAALNEADGLPAGVDQSHDLWGQQPEPEVAYRPVPGSLGALMARANARLDELTAELLADIRSRSNASVDRMNFHFAVPRPDLSDIHMAFNVATVHIDVDIRPFHRAMRGIARAATNGRRLRTTPAAQRDSVMEMQAIGRRELDAAVADYQTHVDGVYADLGLTRQENP